MPPKSEKAKFNQLQQQKENYYNKLSLGLCPKCSCELSVKNGKKQSLCKDCMLKARERSRTRRYKIFGQPVKPSNLNGSVFYCWEVIGNAGIQISAKGRKNRLWKVKCINCSYVCIKSTNKLKSKKPCRQCWLKPKGKTGLHRLFRAYGKSAKRANREFVLIEEEFRKITSSNCYYCGSEPNNKRSSGNPYGPKKDRWGDYFYNGIDRKDNDKGYTLDNCLPCCTTCNRMKNVMKFDDFINHVTKIATKQAS